MDKGGRGVPRPHMGLCYPEVLYKFYYQSRCRQGGNQHFVATSGCPYIFFFCFGIKLFVSFAYVSISTFNATVVKFSAALVSEFDEPSCTKMGNA